MSPRDPMVRFEHMRERAEEAIELARGKTRSALEADRLLFLALVHLVLIVGEAASQVPRQVRLQYPQIEWAAIVGMRHRLIHGYDEVEADALWRTVQEDLPVLVAQLNRIIPERTPDD